MCVRVCKYMLKIKCRCHHKGAFSATSRREGRLLSFVQYLFQITAKCQETKEDDKHSGCRRSQSLTDCRDVCHRFCARQGPAVILHNRTWQSNDEVTSDRYLSAALSQTGNNQFSYTSCPIADSSGSGLGGSADTVDEGETKSKHTSWNKPRRNEEPSAAALHYVSSSRFGEDDLSTSIRLQQRPSRHL